MNGATIKPKLNLVIMHQTCRSNPSRTWVPTFKPISSDSDSVMFKCEQCGTEIWAAVEAVMVEHKHKDSCGNRAAGQ